MGILLLIEKGLDTEDCWNIMLCRKLKQINGDNPFFPIALHVLCLRNILEPDPRLQFWMYKIIRINFHRIARINVPIFCSLSIKIVKHRIINHLIAYINVVDFAGDNIIAHLPNVDTTPPIVSFWVLVKTQ